MHRMTVIVHTIQQALEAKRRLGTVTCSDNLHVFAQLGSCLVPSTLREVIYFRGNGQGHAEHLPEESTATQRLSQRSQTVWLSCWSSLCGACVKQHAVQHVQQTVWSKTQKNTVQKRTVW